MEKKELSEQELLAIVKEKFPKISWQIFEVFNNGWDNQVLLLDKNIVFRFPRNEEVKIVHQREKKLLATIKEYVDIQIPYYEFLTDDDSCVGYSVIPGIPMTVDIYNKKISKTIQKRIQKEIALFLTQLHSIPLNILEKIGYVRGKGTGTSNEWSKGFQDDFIKTCGSFFNEIEIQTVCNYIKELQKLDFDYKVLTHSDVQEKNIFIDDTLTHISGIIDFSDARIADPALDFDTLLEYGEEFVSNVYKYYQGKKDDNLLKRAKFYGKRGYIYALIHAVEHKKDVEKNLDEFRKIFFENT